MSAPSSFDLREAIGREYRREPALVEAAPAKRHGSKVAVGQGAPSSSKAIKYSNGTCYAPSASNAYVQYGVDPVFLDTSTLYDSSVSASAKVNGTPLYNASRLTAEGLPYAFAPDMFS